MQTFCAKLLSQPEEIALCALSTHLDPQLLPYIRAFTLLSLLFASDAYSCSRVCYYSSLFLSATFFSELDVLTR